MSSGCRPCVYLGADGGMNKRRHLTEVMRWSSGQPVEWIEILSSGMALPLLLAVLMDKLSLGMAAAVGSLIAGRAGAGLSIRQHALSLLSTLALIVLTALAAAVAVGHAWLSDILLVAMIGAIAVCGGYSREFAVTASRVIIMLLILMNVLSATPDVFLGILLIIVGAVWTLLLHLLLVVNVVFARMSEELSV